MAERAPDVGTPGTRPERRRLTTRALAASTLSACALVACLAAGCASPERESPAVAIRARSAALATAQERGDADAVAAIYAEDAVVHSGRGSGDVVGRAAIRAMFARAYAKRRPAHVELIPTTVTVGRDQAVEEGLYTASYAGTDGTTQEVRGRYLVAWRRGADGVWRIVEDQGRYAGP